MAKTRPSVKQHRVRFLHKPSCTSCRRARALLENEGLQLDLHDLGKERLTLKDLDQLIGDRDYHDFLNPRNQLYRQRKMGQKPPTRSEALRFMEAEPNLIRRPVVIRGARMVLGFDEQGLKKLAGESSLGGGHGRQRIRRTTSNGKRSAPRENR